MKIEGRFSGASEVFEVGANRTKKRTFRLDITGNSQYENITEFSLIGDKVGFTDDLKNGQHIEVDFNLNGRRWTDTKTGIEKVFTDLQCYSLAKVNKERVQATAPAVAIPPKAEPTAQAPAEIGKEAEENIPF